MNFTKRETATVLAALRYWQQDLSVNDDPPISEHFYDDITPLTPKQIDALCERINFNDPSPALELLHEAVTYWEAQGWDDEDAQIPGADAVDWLCEFIEQVRVVTKEGK